MNSEIKQSPPLGEEPRGPGKCPSCGELESGWSATGQCFECVTKEYDAAITAGYPSDVPSTSDHDLTRGKGEGPGRPHAELARLAAVEKGTKR